MYKRNYSNNSVDTFKQKLREVNWNEVKQSNNANESYAKFSGENEIANEFNKYFADIGPSLAKDIPKPSILFESFLKRVNTTLPSQSLSLNELKDAFFSLKTNKSPGADEINFNVIKHCFGELCGPLKYLFDLSLQSGVFPDLMKIAIVSPIFKTGDTADISNYRPISVLPCFSKILERVMYNRLYKYLTE